jgi:ankyrin repeat protein
LEFFFIVTSEKGRHNDARHAASNTRIAPTAMSSNATHATNTPTEGDTVTHVERALNEMLLKGADCAKCGAVRSTKKCACKLVYYCSKECQRWDWADHKARCTYKKARATANQIDPQEAFPGLPDHLVVTHILRYEYFDDPADLARLPAVSRAMCDAVAGTGLRFKELEECKVVDLGCLSAVQRMQRRGRLSRQELLCAAAARSGQLEELKVLRADGWPWDAETCHAAANSGHLEVLQWLRANGCLWNWATCAYAAGGGHLEVLQWARASRCPWNDFTCTMAAKGGHLEVLQWAHANGCPCDEMELHIATEAGHEAIVRTLIDAIADVNKAMDNGVTPLYISAQNGHKTVVQVLIELGANVSKAMDNGATPLIIATQNGHEAIVRTLIVAGTDVNKAMDNCGTPLYISAQNGHKTVVQVLIELGANVNKVMDTGGTPLYIAARNGDENVVQALIEASADVNKAEVDDCVTPLCVAAFQDHETVVRSLIEASVDVNKAMDNGGTPLYVAAHENHETVVRALIEAGADVNEAADNGATPLIMATRNDHEAIVRALIEAGANANKADDIGSVARQRTEQYVVYKDDWALGKRHLPRRVPHFLPRRPFLLRGLRVVRPSRHDLFFVHGDHPQPRSSRFPDELR